MGCRWRGIEVDDLWRVRTFGAVCFDCPYAYMVAIRCRALKLQRMAGYHFIFQYIGELVVKSELDVVCRVIGMSAPT